METLGNRYGTEPEQFSKAKFIIAWGANIHGTNVHLWPFIVEARRNGAKLVAIDPVRTRTAALADQHLRINPGSDQALAFGLMHVIIGEGLHDCEYIEKFTNGFAALAEKAKAYDPERVAGLTGIAKTDIIQLAREYATVRPAAIRANYGIQRSERGGAATRAIAALPALTGAWKEVGGGLQLSVSQAFQFNRKSALEMCRNCRCARTLGRGPRIVNMSELGSALTALDNPPVQAIVVYNSNPAAIAPDQNRVLKGFAREVLFTSSCWSSFRRTPPITRGHPAARDHVPRAHRFVSRLRALLPHLQLARQAGGSAGRSAKRSNVDVFRALAVERMGFEDSCFKDSEDDMEFRALLSSAIRN